MHERAFRAAAQLRADTDVVTRAAGIVRAASDRTGPARLAGLHAAATTGRLAELLELMAGRLDVVPEQMRDHIVRVAREITGDGMDLPGVRRTRRR